MPRIAAARPVKTAAALGLVAASLSLGLVTTGCAAAPGSRTRPPAAGSAAPAAVPSPAPGSTTAAQGPLSGLRLPIEDYLIGSADAARIQSARAALIGSCMKRFGADYAPAVDLGTRSQMVNRYGPTDPDTARTDGYHAPGALRAPGQQPTEPALPPDLAAVLGHGTGAPQLPGSTAAPTAPAGGTYRGLAVPPGGCVGEAERILTAGGGIVQDDQAAVDINFHDYQRSLDEAAVKSAFARWSGCMSAKGYRYDTPESAVNDHRWRTPTPTAEEIATAGADVACKQQADVVGTWFGAESRLEAQDIQAQLPQLTQVRQAIDTAVKNADSAASPRP
ncbi:hypothetical protein ACFZB9_21975 [Kitasatospora sp. NPDC008050]|uniref:hypothetical protein n=1 Tax=Kitasatospora sp. NPDC008050 TaxID=3364021 RepID=UPI0036E08FDA